MNNKWNSLQNGSDIRGVAVEGVVNEPVTLTNDIVRSIACAFSNWLKEKLNKEQVSISVGHDSRISADTLKIAVFQD